MSPPPYMAASQWTRKPGGSVGSCAWSRALQACRRRVIHRFVRVFVAFKRLD
jgi:hypothetical protein